MGQFVQAGPVIIDLLEEGRLRWHLNIIERGHVEGAVAADMKIDTGCGDDRLGDGDDLPFGQRGRIIGQPFAQSFALGDIEDRKTLEKRNGLDLGRCIAVRRGSVPMESSVFRLLGNEPVGIDDGHALLALADATARLPGLPEGQPALRGPAMRDHRAPQNEDVDARIGPRGERVARQAGQGAAAVACPPWLHPGEASAFQLRDDPGGHLVIEVGPRLFLTSVASTLSTGTALTRFTHGLSPAPP